MNSSVHFSSQTSEYETPHDLFDQLWEEFGGFDGDPCGRVGQHSAQKVWGHGGWVCLPPGDDVTRLERAAVDGLAQPWHGKVFLNPPYGSQIGKWVEKAVAEVANGNAELVVALLPARTDTRWWQRWILGGTWIDQWDSHRGFDALMPPPCCSVEFLPGRLKFVGAKGPAPFPSAIVVWRTG